MPTRRRRFTYRLCFLVALLLTPAGGRAEHKPGARASGSVRAGDDVIDFVAVQGGHAIVMERNSLGRGAEPPDRGRRRPLVRRRAGEAVAGALRRVSGGRRLGNDWGTTAAVESQTYVWIQNKDVVIRDNVIENPVGSAGRWSRLMVAGPYGGDGQGTRRRRPLRTMGWSLPAA